MGQAAQQLQGGKILVSELIVAGAGSLIGAPVCEVATVRIPDELAGWEFRTGQALVAGTASASRAVSNVHEERTLIHRDRDDNARRHAGVFALYDWCWGSDDQWLYETTADEQVHSHDHGFYLPPEGSDFTVDTLVALVDDPHPAGHPTAGLDDDELMRLATALDDVQRSHLVGLLRGVPTEWPVTDLELEAAGYFLERRAPQVARRLRAIAGRSR